MAKSKIKFCSFLFWQKHRCLWHRCQPAECQRWIVDEAWLLATSYCEDKNARSFSLSVHRAGSAILTSVSLFNVFCLFREAGIECSQLVLSPLPPSVEIIQETKAQSLPAFSCMQLLNYLGSCLYLLSVNRFLRHWNSTTVIHQGEASLQPCLFPSLFIRI